MTIAVAVVDDCKNVTLAQATWKRDETLWSFSRLKTEVPHC